MTRWVVVKSTGQVGLSSDSRPAVKGKRQELVQFGASGPYRWFFTTRLRDATSEEVRAAGYEGVGGGATK